MMRSIRRLDIYRKHSSELVQTTLTGAFCSLITIIVINFLIYIVIDHNNSFGP